MAKKKNNILASFADGLKKVLNEQEQSNTKQQSTVQQTTQLPTQRIRTAWQQTQQAQQQRATVANNILNKNNSMRTASTAEILQNRNNLPTKENVQANLMGNAIQRAVDIRNSAPEEQKKKTEEKKQQNTNINNDITNQNMSKKTPATQTTNMNTEEMQAYLKKEAASGNVAAQNILNAQNTNINTGSKGITEENIQKMGVTKRTEEDKQRAKDRLKSRNIFEHLTDLDKLSNDLALAGAPKLLTDTLDKLAPVQATEHTYNNHVITSITNATNALAKDERHLLNDTFLGNIVPEGLKDKRNEQLDEITDYFDDYAEKADKADVHFSNAANKSKTWGYLNDRIAPTLGEMTPSIAASIIAPETSVPSFVTQFFVSKGSYYRDAEQRGMNEEEAMWYSNAMALVEAGTEQLTFKNAKKIGTGAKGIASKLFNKTAKETVTKTGENVAGSFVKDTVIGMIENAAQEAITEPINELVAQGIAGKGDWTNMDNRMKESAVDAAVLELILGGAHAGVPSAQSIKGKIDTNINNNTNTFNNISGKEIKTMISDVGKVIDVNQIVKDSMNQQTNKLKNALYSKGIESASALDKARAIDGTYNTNLTSEIQKALDEGKLNKNTYSELNKQLDQITQLKNSEDLLNHAKELDDTLELKDTEHSLTNVVEKLTNEAKLDNETYGKLKDVFNNIDNNIPYVAETSDNKKIDTFRDDMTNFMNNSVQSHNFAKSVESIIEKTGLNIRLNNQLQDNENGRIFNENGETTIEINPNSNQAGEFVLMHELSHAIGNQDLKQTILDYANKNKDFEAALKDLEARYGQNDVTEEVMADISGQLLGNEEFINSLAQEQPSKFKQIYNAVKSWVKKFTGTYGYEDFVKDVETKWRKAYEQNKNNITENIDQKIMNNKVPLENIPLFSKNESGVNIDKSTYIDYNGNQQTITENMLAAYSIDQRVAEYFKYNHNDDFYNLTYEEMKQASAVVSDRISKGNDNGYANDDKYIYYYDVDDSDNKNYTIKDITEIKEGREEIADERDISRDSRYPVSERIRQSNGTSNDQSTRYNTTSSETTSMDSKESTSNSSRNNKEIIGNKQTINQESENNSGSFILSKNNKTQQLDNQGRTLTKEQQEYFKDSKARDENGNLLTVYHGTNNDFTIFDKSYLGTASGDVGFLGDGIYLATHKGEAGYYGSNIMSGYVDIKNPFNIKELIKYDGSFLDGEDSSIGLEIYNLVNMNEQWGDITIDGHSYNEIANETKNFLENAKVKRLGDVEDFSGNITGTMWEIDYKGKKQEIESIPSYTQEKVFADSLNDNIKKEFGYLDSHEILQNITHEHRENPNIKSFSQVLQEKGFDSVVQGTPQTTDEILIFDSSQFKNIDNTNPTSNPDIRYSKQTDKWQDFLNKNFPSRGTTNKLSDMKQMLPTKESSKTVLEAKKQEIAPTTTEETSMPLRTTEQIANDNNISDIEAMKEETEQVNIPSKKIAEQVEKELASRDIEKSPTIDFIKEKRSKEKTTFKEIKDELAQKFVNKGHYIDKLAKQTKNEKLTWLYDRTMNSFNEAQISIGDNQINSNGEVVGKSIIDIFKPAEEKKLTKEFNDYLLNKHNIARYGYEKGVFGTEVSAEQSKQIVDYYEKKYPEFKEWGEEASKYNDNNLVDLVDNGLVSDEMYKKLRNMYPDYVPTFRDITEDMSNFTVDDRVGTNTLKKATGSNLDILSVQESMAEQTLAIKKAIRMNNLGLELYNTLHPSKSDIILSGVEFDPSAMMTLNGDVVEKNTDGTNMFTIFDDGEMKTFKISDELYSAFKKDTLQNKINNSKAAKALLTPLEKLSKFQRELLTTYSIGFSLNNPIKDFSNALVNTKFSDLKFIKNYPKALYNLATKGDWYKSYKNNGGYANTYFDYDKGLLPTKTKNPIKKFANKIAAVNEVLEQAPRLTEYISTIENGGTIDEALYNAADVTVNFKRGGDITKAVNKYGANFLNASVQGLDKTYRNIIGQNGVKGYTRLMLNATIASIAPAIINNLVLGDDDDYEELPDYIKDNYFLFKIGDNKFFRIPKGNVSAVVGSIARRANDAVEGKEVNWKSLVDTAVNQLAPNNPVTDNVLAPLIQAKNNKAWYGGDIVSTRLQKLPAAEQYDEKTDSISKFLGKTLNISPKKINYVLDQYSGGIGDVILPTLTPQAENNILEDKFTTNSTMKSKYPSEFFSKSDELQISSNSENATDEDKLKYMLMNELKSGKNFKIDGETISTGISDLYAQKRAIQNSSVSDKEKKEELEKVQKQINTLARYGIENSDNIEIDGNTATIPGSDFKWINENGTWKKVDDKTKTKLKQNNISLESYANYQDKVARYKSNLQDDESLKQADKIKILRNMKMSDKDKKGIYSAFVGTTDTAYDNIKNNVKINDYLDYKTDVSGLTKNTEKIQKLKQANYSSQTKQIIYENTIGKDDEAYAAVKNVVPIDSYLDYKSQSFYADKDSNGKSISGSRKQKIVDYLNSSYMRYEDKLIILGMNNKLSSSELSLVFNYVNSQSIPTNQKIAILKKVKGFTVNGNNVNW